MKPLNNRLYIEFKEMVDAIATIEQKEPEKVSIYLRKSNSTQNGLLPFIKDPVCRTNVLYDWQEMGDKYKAIVQKRFGNPFEYVAKEPLRKLLVKDFKAEEFYLNYRFDGDRALPIEHRNKYVTAASWLNLVEKLAADTRYIKKELGLTMEGFWSNLMQLFATDGVELPTTTRNLRPLQARYKEEGYAVLIDKKFGNKNAAKVGKSCAGFDASLYEKQVAIIRTLSSKHQNYDAAQIARVVNVIFEKQEWPTISHGTVANVIKENRHLTTAGARGKRVYDSTLAMQVKRRASQFPLLHCVLDGWTVELLYQDERGHNNRMVVVIVLDSCGKYPLGYAIGDRENADLIRQACRNAVLHAQELFGGAYRPLQLQSDHYALKNLTPFYEALTKLHTPAAVGNAKAKVIEPYFNTINHQYFQAFPNWSGHNTTSRKENQPNIEYLDKIKHSFPDRAGVIRQIEMVMHQERQVKLADYRKAWDLSPDSNKLVMSKMDWLGVFGRPHTHQNSITGQGIICSLDGTERTYDTFDPSFRALQHLKWNLLFDEANMHEVLAISEDGKNRFVLHEKRILPMDLHSTTADDHSYLSKVRHFNKARTEEIIQTYITDDAITQEVIDSTPLALNDYTEAAIKLMFTTRGQQKEALQDAKGLRKQKAIAAKQEAKVSAEETAAWHSLQQQYLQSKTDFNQYLD